MIFNESYTLSNGVNIPKLGLGTWEIPDERAARAVCRAIKIGYRHIDTAQGYGNECGVGEGIRTCGVKREDIFVTTKLDAFIKDYAGAVKAIDNSLNVMGLDYIDMMIIHAPQPWTHFREGERYFEGNIEAWRALEDAYKSGKLRAIGVSNFEIPDIDNIIENCTVVPMANQILAHISNTPFDIIEYSQNKGMLIEAYSPIGHGEMLKNNTVAGIAEDYCVSVPQLCIKYCLQLGLLPLPKAENPKHMEDNSFTEYEISDEDMEILKSIEPIENYGDFSLFPVFGGKMQDDGTCVPRNFKGGSLS